jgi:hypothetical protein
MLPFPITQFRSSGPRIAGDPLLMVPELEIASWTLQEIAGNMSLLTKFCKVMRNLLRGVDGKSRRIEEFRWWAGLSANFKREILGLHTQSRFASLLNYYHLITVKEDNHQRLSRYVIQSFHITSFPALFLSSCHPKSRC